MRRIITLILIAFALTSCSHKAKVRRAEKKVVKLTKKYPELLQKDTVKIIDTVVVESVTHDTVTKMVYHDSVTVVDNERVYLKYFYDTVRKEIYHEVECKADTVIREHEVVHDKVVVREKPNYWILFLVVVVCFIVYRLINTVKSLDNKS